MAETELSWVERAADAAIEHAHRSGGKQIVCASGVSPSGPIHLGNLREVMTAHFVAEEIFSQLMGDEVSHRKRFIQSHSDQLGWVPHSSM